jgi:hypothetical protein
MMDFNRYPENWKEFSREIREKRAKGRCECLGTCGLHKTTPGPRRCTERNGKPALWAKGKIILTVAHLDYDDGPCRCFAETGKKCAIPEHVKAMCNRCHLRMDMPHHVRNARNTRRSRLAVGDLFGG